MLFSDSRDSRFVPRQFPERFFPFSNMATRKRSRMAGLEWKRRQVFHFQNRRVFLLSQGMTKVSVLSQSLTILCSVAGISHSRGEGELLPYNRLMGMGRWMGSHFHVWIDKNGVHIFGFLG